MSTHVCDHGLPWMFWNGELHGVREVPKTDQNHQIQAIFPSAHMYKHPTSNQVAAEAAPAAMEETAAPAAAAATDTPAVSEEKKKEAEGEALKMLEFYFGDSNFGWDRFMQSKVTAVWTGARRYDRSGMLDSLARGGTRVCAFSLVASSTLAGSPTKAASLWRGKNRTRAFLTAGTL